MKQELNANDWLKEQIVNISKAGAYDAISPEYSRLQTENKQLKERVKFLEELINEYTLKMKANLSGGKVDQFLKEQVAYKWSESEQEIMEEERIRDERNDIKDVL